MSTSLKEIQEQSYRIAKAHGFWNGSEQDNIPTKIALAHGELSEALQEFREGRTPTQVYYEYKAGLNAELVDLRHGVDGTDYVRPTAAGSLGQWLPIEPGETRNVMVSFGYEAKPEGFGVELADAIIRICDLAERHGIDLTEMIALKAAYNEGRPHMHNRRV